VRPSGSFVVPANSRYREVAADERLVLEALFPVAELHFALDGRRTRDLFLFGHCDRRPEHTGLVKPRLVPRHERHRPPARIVEDRQ
jgi:hypothetical protein